MSSQAAEPSLRELQAWLRCVVTDPGGLDAGLRHAARQYGGGGWVSVPTGTHPKERLAIYARGYLNRLLSCLRADYPALRALLGSELFDHFALDYLRAYPPTHYSLFELGAHFPEHLAASRPDDASVAAEHRSFLRLPIDVALAERARLEVLRAPGTEGRPASPTHVHALLSDLRATLEACSTPCLRVLALAHDVRPLIAAVDRGTQPVAAEPRPVYLAVSRSSYRVTLTELAGWQYHVLDACRSPQSCIALARHAAKAEDCEVGPVWADLLFWLPVAQELGMVTLQARTDAAARDQLPPRLPVGHVGAEHASSRTARGSTRTLV